MTEKRLNRLLAVFFVVVGLLAMVNTYRLHDYIAETMPRDRAQEECQSELLGVLKGWVAGRYLRDETIDDEKTANVVVIDKLLAGQQPTTEELQAWRDAVVADNAERVRGTTAYHDLPDCTP